MKHTHDHPGSLWPRHYWHQRRLVFPLAAALAHFLSGCSTANPTVPPDDLRPEGRRAVGERPAALINDQPLTWDQVLPSLSEAAGGIVLEEAALDRLVAAEYLARLGKGPEAITNDRIATERAYFIDAIGRASAVGPDQAAVLASGIREARGLGDVRFTALLRRTAMMRELVAPGVAITPELVEQRFMVRFGERYRVRIITCATEAEAALVLDEVRAMRGEPLPSFAALAARLSTDESRFRGGALEPISPADPAYSPALRAALVRLRTGEPSGVIALDPGFGVILLDEVIPAQPTTLAEQRAEVEDELRRRQERVLMDTMARGLLQSARISPMDPSIGWSWKNRNASARP